MPSGQDSSGEKRRTRAWVAKIAAILGIIWATLSMIGVAVFFFPVVRAYGNQYGAPTPGWIYAAAGAGAYLSGPLLVALSVRLRLGIGRYGAIVSVVGVIIAFMALHSRNVDRGDLDPLDIISTLGILLIPQTCSLGLILIFYRKLSKGDRKFGWRKSI